jgi:hypothetical protein
MGCEFSWALSIVRGATTEETEVSIPQFQTLPDRAFSWVYLPGSFRISSARHSEILPVLLGDPVSPVATRTGGDMDFMLWSYNECVQSVQ